MRTPVRLRRAVARTLVLTTMLLAVQFPVGAGGASLFNGRVVEPDGLTPRAGVVVRLVETAGERAYPSAPTDADGRFRIEDAPEGNYLVVADTAEGAYLATEELKLSEGRNHPLQLTLAARADAAGATTGAAGVGGAKKGLPKAIKAVIAGILVLSAFFAFDSNTEDVASDTTPF